ncbi:hypothetical protein ACMHYO_12145 [Allopusillimonas ginsengisoli]|uniref:hypothetical protein n=1 Tax=Allopusillimonas ginsengisoli TaxID=453575 RepID=UPI0039C342EE
MKRRAVYLLSIVLTGFTAAQAQPTLQGAHDLGIGFATQQKDEVGTSRINEQTASEVPLYRPNPVQQNNYEGGFGDMLGIGVGRITQSRSYSPGSCDKEGFDPEQAAKSVMGPQKWATLSASQRQRAIEDQITYFDQECEGINFLAGEYKMRNRAEIPPTDDLANWTPPQGTPDGNGNCSMENVSIPPEYVTEYCYESRTIENRFCEEHLNVQCEPPPPGNCAIDGVVRGSVSVSQASYGYTFNGSTLVLINNVTASFSQTWAKFNFNVSGADRIQEFRATYIQSDNWVGFSVNGHFIGTHSRYFGGLNLGSDRLTMASVKTCANQEQQCIEWSNGDQGGCQAWETVCTSYYYSTRVQYSPSGYGPPETGDSFGSSVNVDIRPYLKEGNNEITMYVIDGGMPGNGRISFNVYQKCPPNCSYTWSDNCAPFESVLVN